MKKILHKIIIILVLLIEPHHVTTSGGKLSIKSIEERNLKLNNEKYYSNSEIESEKKRILLKIKISNIKNEIEQEYKIFNLNLDTISRVKFTKDFIENLMCSALESKSLPSIAIAQAAIETGYGKHLKLKNNIFGIKGRGIKTKTKEYINGNYVVINSEFQYFKTQKHAFNRHFAIINGYGVKGDNYRDWIKTIVSHGYATDPKYGWKLNYIISLYQLYRLDNIQKLNSQLIEVSENKILMEL